MKGLSCVGDIIDLLGDLPHIVPLHHVNARAYSYLKLRRAKTIFTDTNKFMSDYIGISR